MTPPYARTDEAGRIWHLGQDGWFIVSHGAAPSLPVSTGSGLALEELLDLAPDVSPELTVRDGLALAIRRAATPFLVVLPHDVPPSEGKTATLDFAGLRNVDR